MMFDIVCKDYSPKEVNTKDVSIVTYGGDRIKGITGIEFPIDKPATDYEEIHQPEVTK
jgi:hypothetical protein